MHNAQENKFHIAYYKLMSSDGIYKIYTMFENVWVFF